MPDNPNFLRTLFEGYEPNIDIVAVHGLNPKNNEDRAGSTWSSGDKLWLRDFLPNQLPRARVLLFGYNSNVAIQSSSAGVREHAYNLLAGLWLERRVGKLSLEIYRTNLLSTTNMKAYVIDKYRTTKIDRLYSLLTVWVVLWLRKPSYKPDSERTTPPSAPRHLA